MMIKYKIKKHLTEAVINEVEVLRETEHCVILPAAKSKRNPKGERKESKMSTWYQYFNTWEDAHSALRDIVARKLTYASKELTLAHELVAAVKDMVKPL